MNSSSTGSSTRHDQLDFWKQKAHGYGFALIDDTLQGDGWDDLLANGRLEVKRAAAATGMRTGKDLSVLELGCGVGRLSFALADLYGSVIGVDVSPSFIETADSHNDRPNVRFLVTDGNQLPAEVGLVDVIFCYEVFHYVPAAQLERYCGDAVSHLNRGGQFVFEVNVVPVTILTAVARAARYVMHHTGIRRWRGFPTDPGFRRISHRIADLRRWLEVAGFVVERVIDQNPAQTWLVASKP